ncbi:VWA domain-containing protein [Biformimicrobium ophioploci]|uniref:VWFA domain-containing protein n=1 Tax=Biformimicrobium ophioploci TaxID=3036711 RepID=A0ABQ6LUP7_9GAMM|nr:VWA domain-containing protein [Microbulbifer sp. NKW57]GMG85810.1 hypothetical protein MNKW57_01310 [Microbulbifer sp. NKW57]
MPDLAAFHFLRPWALLLLPLALALALYYRRRRDSDNPWRGYISPELLQHLVITPSGAASWLPLALFIGTFAVIAVAVAGPSWSKQPLPTSPQEAPLVIALQLTDSMRADDVRPSRLALARLKIRSLLDARKGAAHGLVVFAGSAHWVLPPTEDAALLRQYLDELRPDIMPVPGKSPASALTMAAELAQEQQGAVIVMGDGFESVTSAASGKEVGVPWSYWLFGTEAGIVSDEVTLPRDVETTIDRATVRESVRSAGGQFMAQAADDSDVERIVAFARKRASETAARDDALAWKDSGYWLTWPIVLLLLFWFRRGMVLRWQ